MKVTNSGSSPVSLTGWKLTDEGAKHSYTFSGTTVPAHVTSWQQNLIAWSAARLSPLPTPPAAGNPYGITARTIRKSWESWLLAACPDQIVRITLSQDHTETIALRHSINVAFNAGEREAIVAEVIGWCR